MKRGHDSDRDNNIVIHEDLEAIAEESEPIDPDHRDPPSGRPSKLRRHGSKLLSALRSFTSSGSNPSNQENTPPETPPECSRVSRSFLKFVTPPTIMHRGPQKGRVSEASAPGNSPCVESKTFPSNGKTGGKNLVFSEPSKKPSTGQTALGRQLIPPEKARCAPSRDIYTQLGQHTGPGFHSFRLPLIEEAVHKVSPTVLTVEKAASTKIFLETFYNELLSRKVAPRSLRLRELEMELSNDRNLTPAWKDQKRMQWLQQETDYLREIRAMKARQRVPKGYYDKMCSKYNVVKVLGKGSFGVVRLVSEKAENIDQSWRKEVYAMKVIRKADMLRNSQEGHLRAERDFLVASEGSRWIVPLIASFQDFSNLYLVMEYMPGGDFLGLLIRQNTLPEECAKHYIAEMILCIEEAHSLHWIHRDIKPDNFLISSSGHLKISDFGLAFDGHWCHDQSYYSNHRYSMYTKLNINVEGDTLDRKEARTAGKAMLDIFEAHGKKRHEIEESSSDTEEGQQILNWRNKHGNRTLARSVVGTSQYMAPEVVRGDPYDARCDWWSVAIILYECLYGRTPFLAEEGGRQQTKINILNHEQCFAFPSKPQVSPRCQDLIRSILREKDDRLCSMRYRQPPRASRGAHRDYTGRYVYPHDAEDIKQHRWFRGIQWNLLHVIDPPFRPNLKSTDDTHYFDEEEPISDFSSSSGGDSCALEKPTSDEVNAALIGFNREIQILAREFVGCAYDSTRLRGIERDIDSFVMTDEQKDYLRRFVRAYGTKEKKRPRDRVLRDKYWAPKVLQIRKDLAFKGYSYRRIRRPGQFQRTPLDVAGFVARPEPVMSGGGKGKGSGWQKARMSIN